MTSLGFYDRQLEFQNKLSNIREEQLKLEQEFEKLNLPCEDAVSDRILELEAYHKKLCERERAAQDRNCRLFADFDEVKRQMATMQLHTSRLKQAKNQCMREVERLYPEWKQQLQVNRASHQLNKASAVRKMAMTHPQPKNMSTPVPKQQYQPPSHSSLINLSSVSSSQLPPPTPQCQPPHASKQLNFLPGTGSSPKPVKKEPSLESIAKPANDEHAVEADKDSEMEEVSFSSAITSDNDENEEIVEVVEAVRKVAGLDEVTTVSSTNAVHNEASAALEADNKLADSKQVVKKIEKDSLEAISSDDNSDDEHNEKISEVKVAPGLPAAPPVVAQTADRDEVHNTEPFTSVHDSVETFNSPIIIPGLKESTLDSTMDDSETASSSVSSSAHQATTGQNPLAASSAYQALRDTMDSSNLKTLSQHEDDDGDDAENILSPNATNKANDDQQNLANAVSSDSDEFNSSSILSSGDGSTKNLKNKTPAYVPSMTQQKTKRYRAPWESDDDDEDDYIKNINEKSAKQKDDDDDDFDFYD